MRNVRKDKPNEWAGIWRALGGKWTFHILRLLAENNMRFNALKRELEDVSATTLSKRLKELEEENVIKRNVEATLPPSVMYSLTKKGEKIVNAIDKIENLEK